MGFKKNLLAGAAVFLLALIVCFAMFTPVFAASAPGDTGQTLEEWKFGINTVDEDTPVIDIQPAPLSALGIEEIVEEIVEEVSEEVVLEEPVPAPALEVGNEHFQALLAAFPTLWDAEKGVTQPVFNLAAANVIHEEVWVEMPIESFATGQKEIAKDKRDLICIRITRPRPTDPNYPHTANPANPTGVIKVPVLMVHSPYRGNNQPNVDYNRAVVKNHPNTEFIDNPLSIDGILHTGRRYGVNPDTSNYTYDDVKSDRLRIADWPFDDAAHADPYYHIPASRGAKPIAMASSFSSGAIASGALSPENYAFTRGFAVVQTSMGGNRYSLSTSSATAGPFNDGLNTYGEAYEMLAGLAAIKWLNGECRAYKTRDATEEVIAYWANGDVAMTGQSYVGTTTMGVASSGYPGLKAIIPRAGISNMYEYFRKDGTVYPGASAQGEDAEWLSRYDMARWTDPSFALGQPDRTAYENIMARVADEISRETGDYNKYWDMGNWVAQANIYKAAVLFMQGFDDRNVGTKHFDSLYRALKEIDPNYPIKGLLHLQNHTSPFNWGTGDFLGTYHQWLDRFVYGIENGIDTNGIDVWVADNVTGECHTYSQWPAVGKDTYRYYFGPTGTGGGQLFTNAPVKEEVEGPFFDQLKYRVREDLTNPADPFYNMSVVNDHNTGSTNWWYNLEDWLQGAWEATMLFPTARPQSSFPDDRFAYVNVDKTELLKHTNARLAYVSETLTEPVTLSGVAKVSLDIIPDKGIGSVSAMIVDLGDARRNYQTSSTVASLQIPAFTNGYNAYSRFQYTFATTITPYKVVARSSVDIQNPNPSGITYLDTAITKNSAFMAPFTYQTAVIEPGEPYHYTFTLEPRHYTFREGSRLAVVIYSTDYKHTIRPYEATKLELTLGENSYIDLPLMSPLPAVSAPNYHVYMDPQQTDLNIGETLLVDVMLTGDLNYSQFSSEIAYDANLLKYEGYADLKGLVAAVSPLMPGKISVRSVPSLNMVFGEPCSPAVKIVTLKFTVTNNFSENSINTALSFNSAVVNPPAGVIGAQTAPLQAVSLDLNKVGDESFQANMMKYPALYDKESGVSAPAWRYDPTNVNNIVEEVYVEVPCDTDGDGQRDLIRLWIRRPSQSAEPGIRVPVIYEQSPYREQTNPLVNHNSSDPLIVNPDTTDHTYEKDIVSGKARSSEWYWGDEAKLTAADKILYGPYGIPASHGAGAAVSTRGGVFNGGTWTTTGRYTWYDYFVPRGYALILGSSIGNKFSDGFTNCGDVEEILCAMATIKWLNGEVKAYTDQSCTVEVDATFWSNGNVALLGQSYNGTIPIGTACSGVEGLKAILPVAGISSWYDYYRENGGVIAANNFQGEDADILAIDCDSRRINIRTTGTYSGATPPFAPETAVPSWLAYYTPTGQPYTVLRQRYEDFMDQMRIDQDRVTGDYNSFWDDRNYLSTVDKVNCGIILSHGFNDFNVKPKQMDQFYQGVKEKTSAPIKLMLHRGAHAQIWDYEQPKFFEYAHKWFDHFLYGIENGIVDEIPEVSLANNITGDFEFYDKWPVPNSTYKTYYLDPTGTGSAGALSVTPPAVSTKTVKDSLASWTGSNLSTAQLTTWETRIIGYQNLTAANTERLIFLSDITDDFNGAQGVRLSGTIKLALEAASDKPFGYVSAYLVDLGSDTRAFGTKNMSVVPAAGGAGSYQLVDYTIATTRSDYKIICTGHTDLQNPNPAKKIYKDSASTSFIPAYYYQTKALTPGQYEQYYFEFEPNDYIFKKGNTMGIVVFTTDYRNTPNPQETPELTIRFGPNTYVEIPSVGSFNTK